MHPLTVITGILLGSCLSIAVSLAAVLFVYSVLGDDYPRLQGEFWPLLINTAIFFGMTFISALSFYSLLINHQYRHWAQAVMWACFLSVGWFYWP
jgi:TctA family transporter